MNKETIQSELRKENEELHSLLSKALARIAELEAQLNATSKNSSRPPSSDGFRKTPALPSKKGGKK